jgi:N-acylneuraminate cytidylyltransferase
VTKSIAIIPARGGSQRVPRKNIRDFCGMPMIQYPIRALVESELFEEIVVTTDSPEIASVARLNGVRKVVDRPPSLSGSSVATIDVIAHAINELSIDSLDLVCCVYATNPFLTPSLLQFSHHVAVSVQEAIYVTPVVPYGFPIQRSLTFDGTYFTMADNKHLYSHSQNLDPRFHETAQFWWARASTWLGRHPMQGQILGILVPEWFQQDIDTDEDWHYAELKFRVLQHNSSFALTTERLSLLNPHLNPKIE